MYREKPGAQRGSGALVTLRRYLDPMAAELDRARLSADGIEAHVREAASFNPALSGVTGGARLEVRAVDAERAEALLDAPSAEADEPLDDGEGEDVVRCPRCELAYCFHEKANLEMSSAAVGIAFLAAPILAFRRKRWHCHKCGHVWDDPKEGPRRMTALAPGDPRPVFRLRRDHGGMGLFLGLMLMLPASLVVALLPRSLTPLVVLALVLPIVGYFFGKSWGYDVCSAPGCRAPLTPDREDCPRCKGDIAGVIALASEHHAAAADFRRELAALHAEDEAASPKKTKRKRSVSDDGDRR
jgi:hypothetical protein